MSGAMWNPGVDNSEDTEPEMSTEPLNEEDIESAAVNNNNCTRNWSEADESENLELAVENIKREGTEAAASLPVGRDADATDSEAMEADLTTSAVAASGVTTSSVSHKKTITQEESASRTDVTRATGCTALPEAVGASVEADESQTPDDIRDDDDENDEDEEDLRNSAHNSDPERLKAFNLFVRLFIDENLDRTVPISKQPKEKIQAILDACDRQFGEFHDRARKRVRTYLKSCRRLKRCKDGSEPPARPTPPHLTSVVAESILAQACENESSNAKRMRLGLDPLPAAQCQAAKSQPFFSSLSAAGQRSSPPVQQSYLKQELGEPTTIGAPRDYLDPLDRCNGARARSDFSPRVTSPKMRSTDAGYGRFARSRGNDAQTPSSHQQRADKYGYGLFGALQFGHSKPSSRLQSVVSNNNSQQTGPTDLSVKKSGVDGPAAAGLMTRNLLSAAELATVKQLIVSYRESAAFLYRSAEELEQLLTHHN